MDHHRENDHNLNNGSQFSLSIGQDYIPESMLSEDDCYLLNGSSDDSCDIDFMFMTGKYSTETQESYGNFERLYNEESTAMIRKNNNSNSPRRVSPTPLESREQHLISPTESNSSSNRNLRKKIKPWEVDQTLSTSSHHGPNTRNSNNNNKLIGTVNLIEDCDEIETRNEIRVPEINSCADIHYIEEDDDSFSERLSLGGGQILNSSLEEEEDVQEQDSHWVLPSTETTARLQNAKEIFLPHDSNQEEEESSTPKQQQHREPEEKQELVPTPRTSATSSLSGEWQETGNSVVVNTNNQTQSPWPDCASTIQSGNSTHDNFNESTKKHDEGEQVEDFVQTNLQGEDDDLGSTGAYVDPREQDDFFLDDRTKGTDAESFGSEELDNSNHNDDDDDIGFMPKLQDSLIEESDDSSDDDNISLTLSDGEDDNVFAAVDEYLNTVNEIRSASKLHLSASLRTRESPSQSSFFESVSQAEISPTAANDICTGSSFHSAQNEIGVHRDAISTKSSEQKVYLPTTSNHEKEEHVDSVLEKKLISLSSLIPTETMALDRRDESMSSSSTMENNDTRSMPIVSKSSQCGRQSSISFNEDCNSSMDGSEYTKSSTEDRPTALPSNEECLIKPFNAAVAKPSILEDCKDSRIPGINLSQEQSFDGIDEDEIPKDHYGPLSSLHFDSKKFVIPEDYDDQSDSDEGKLDESISVSPCKIIQKLESKSPEFNNLQARDQNNRLDLEEGSLSNSVLFVDDESSNSGKRLALKNDSILEDEESRDNATEVDKNKVDPIEEERRKTMSLQMAGLLKSWSEHSVERSPAVMTRRAVIMPFQAVVVANLEGIVEKRNPDNNNDNNPRRSQHKPSGVKQMTEKERSARKAQKAVAFSSTVKGGDESTTPTRKEKRTKSRKSQSSSSTKSRWGAELKRVRVKKPKLPSGNIKLVGGLALSENSQSMAEISKVETKRRLWYEGELQAMKLEWDHYKNALKESITESGKIQKLIGSSHTSFLEYSKSIDAIGNDAFVGSDGQPLSQKKRLQQSENQPDLCKSSFILKSVFGSFHKLKEELDHFVPLMEQSFLEATEFTRSVKERAEYLEEQGNKIGFCSI
jgi:hypothetical protein